MFHSVLLGCGFGRGGGVKSKGGGGGGGGGSKSLRTPKCESRARIFQSCWIVEVEKEISSLLVRFC